MDLDEFITQYLNEGYKYEDATAKVSQDIILKRSLIVSIIETLQSKVEL